MPRIPEPLRVLVPAPDELTDRLTELSKLLTGTRWTVAAVVHAYCEPVQGARRDLGRFRPRLSFSEFAELGVRGLRRRHTVSRYYYAWKAAIDAGKATALEVGDEVLVPDMEWPAVAPPVVEAERTVAEAAEALDAVDPETVRLAITTSAKVADAAASALRERRRQLHGAWTGHRDRPMPPSRPTPGPVGAPVVSRFWLAEAEGALRRFAAEIDGRPLTAEAAVDVRQALGRLVLTIGAIRLRLGGDVDFGDL